MDGTVLLFVGFAETQRTGDSVAVSDGTGGRRREMSSIHGPFLFFSVVISKLEVLMTMYFTQGVKDPVNKAIEMIPSTRMSEEGMRGFKEKGE